MVSVLQDHGKLKDYIQFAQTPRDELHRMCDRSSARGGLVSQRASVFDVNSNKVDGSKQGKTEILRSGDSGGRFVNERATYFDTAPRRNSEYSRTSLNLTKSQFYSGRVGIVSEKASCFSPTPSNQPIRERRARRFSDGGLLVANTPDFDIEGPGRIAITSVASFKDLRANMTPRGRESLSVAGEGSHRFQSEIRDSRDTRTAELTFLTVEAADACDADEVASTSASSVGTVHLADEQSTGSASPVLFIACDDVRHGCDEKASTTPTTRSPASSFDDPWPDGVSIDGKSHADGVDLQRTRRYIPLAYAAPSLSGSMKEILASAWNTAVCCAIGQRDKPPPSGHRRRVATD